MSKVQNEPHHIQRLRSWKERLEQIDSVFAQLFYLSGLRNAAGAYWEEDLVSFVAPEIQTQFLKDAHRAAFRRWLSLSPKSRLRDLRLYRETICLPPAGLTEQDLKELCRRLMPSGLSIIESRLFANSLAGLADLVILSTSADRGKLQPNETTRRLISTWNATALSNKG